MLATMVTVMAAFMSFAHFALVVLLSRRDAGLTIGVLTAATVRTGIGALSSTVLVLVRLSPGIGVLVHTAVCIGVRNLGRAVLTLGCFTALGVGIFIRNIGICAGSFGRPSVVSFRC